MARRPLNSPHETKVDKVRKCLRCGEPFPSNGPHNRICTGCSDANAGQPKQNDTSGCGKRKPGRATE